MTETKSNNTRIWGSALSVLLLIPALLLVIPGLIFSFSGSNVSDQLPAFVSTLTSPWIVLSGLVLSLLLNMRSVGSMSLDNREGSLVASFEIKKSAVGLTLLGLALLLGLAIFAYLVVENILPII